MNKKETPLETVDQLDDIEIEAIKERGIESVEDLLAKIKSYGDATDEIARLIGIREKRILSLIKEARAKVSEEFLELLDTPFDPDRFYFGALPPEEEDKN